MISSEGEVVLRASPGTPSFDATSEARKYGTNITSSSCHPSSCLFSSLPFHLTPIPLREELLHATMNLRAQLHQHKETKAREFFRQIFWRKAQIKITRSFRVHKLHCDLCVPSPCWPDVHSCVVTSVRCDFIHFDSASIGLSVGK